MACLRPSISKRVRLSGSVPSQPARWTRFMYVSSPVSCMAPQVPPIVFRSAGSTPSAMALRERLAEVGRVEVGVFLVGLVRGEFTRRPVAVRLRVLGHPLEEGRLVDAGQVEHHRRRHHVLGWRLVDRRARPRRDVSVAGRVDDPAGEDRFAAGLGLRHDADDFRRRPSAVRRIDGAASRGCLPPRPVGRRPA